MGGLAEACLWEGWGCQGIRAQRNPRPVNFLDNVAAFLSVLRVAHATYQARLKLRCARACVAPGVCRVAWQTPECAPVVGPVDDCDTTSSPDIAAFTKNSDTRPALLWSIYYAQVHDGVERYYSGVY